MWFGVSIVPGRYKWRLAFVTPTMPIRATTSKLTRHALLDVGPDRADNRHRQPSERDLTGHGLERRISGQIGREFDDSSVLQFGGVEAGQIMHQDIERTLHGYGAAQQFVARGRQRLAKIRVEFEATVRLVLVPAIDLGAGTFERGGRFLEIHFCTGEFLLVMLTELAITSSPAGRSRVHEREGRRRLRLGGAPEFGSVGIGGFRRGPAHLVARAAPAASRR